MVGKKDGQHSIHTDIMNQQWSLYLGENLVQLVAIMIYCHIEQNIEHSNKVDEEECRPDL